MKYRQFRLLALGLCLGWVAFGFSGTAALAACEGITNAFAYNNCLANAGPQKRARGSRAAPGEDPEATVRGRGRRARAEAPDTRGVVISRRTGRRVSAIIDPWSGIRSPKPARRTRRR